MYERLASHTHTNYVCALIKLVHGILLHRNVVLRNATNLQNALSQYLRNSEVLYTQLGGMVKKRMEYTVCIAVQKRPGA